MLTEISIHCSHTWDQVCVSLSGLLYTSWGHLAVCSSRLASARQLEWSESLPCVCHTPGYVLIMMAEVQESNKYTYVQKWHNLSSCGINANLNAGHWKDKCWGTGLVKWCWMFSHLVEREPTGKSPHMVIWQMCSPFGLDIILLGIYP